MNTEVNITQSACSSSVPPLDYINVGQKHGGAGRIDWGYMVRTGTYCNIDSVQRVKLHNSTLKTTKSGLNQQCFQDVPVYVHVFKIIVRRTPNSILTFTIQADRAESNQRRLCLVAWVSITMNLSGNLLPVSLLASHWNRSYLDSDRYYLDELDFYLMTIQSFFSFSHFSVFYFCF